ncbi:MAG: LysR family transcriptional regulator [Sphaerochaetaceae bacterium]|nr:LysR family transcriptional regulator [Sphaerochaetaceae bacterium]
MDLKVKLYLVDGEGEKFMGIGVMWLLEELARCGSLRQAAMNMDISYSKALLMINRLEKHLGKNVIERKKGGQDRGGASLSPFGQSFIKLYNSFQDEAKKRTEEPYREFVRNLDILLEEDDE